MRDAACLTMMIAMLCCSACAFAPSISLHRKRFSPDLFVESFRPVYPATHPTLRQQSGPELEVEEADVPKYQEEWNPATLDIAEFLPSQDEGQLSEDEMHMRTAIQMALSRYDGFFVVWRYYFLDADILFLS